MPKTKEQETLKPDIKYPQTLHVVPFDYDLYSKEEWNDTAEGDLAVYMTLDEAEESSGMDEGEAWIAVYELKEMVRVKKMIAVKDRVVRSK